MDCEGRQGPRLLNAEARRAKQSDARVLKPDAYARWRSSPLGRITERIEQKAILASAGELRGLSLLDAGCGDGAYSILAWKRGAKVTALDASKSMIFAARERSLVEGARIDFVEASVEKLPFAAESFDVVFMVTVLCLVNSPLIALREAERVLRPGGRLIVGELGSCSLWALKRRLSGWLGNPFWSNAHFWTQYELHEVITNQGLKVRSTRGSIYYPPFGCAAQLLGGAEGVLSHLGGFGAAFLTVRAEKV